jgi:hypothetical protein
MPLFLPRSPLILDSGWNVTRHIMETLIKVIINKLGANVIPNLEVEFKNQV